MLYDAYNGTRTGDPPRIYTVRNYTLTRIRASVYTFKLLVENLTGRMYTYFLHNKWLYVSFVFF